MRRPLFWMSAVVLVAFWTISGCTIVNREGKEIVRIESPFPDKKDESAKKKDEEEKKAKEKKEAEKALAGAGKKVGEARQKVNPQAKSDEKSTGGTKSSNQPWWFKPKIKVKDIKETEPPAEGEGEETSSERPPQESAVAPLDADAVTGGPDGETTGPDATDKSNAPVKRTVQVDRFLQQIPAPLWTETYVHQTTKISPAARRASMEQVEQGIKSGYGSAYVTKMEKALSLDRTNGYAYYFLARGRFEQGDWKGARSFGENAAQRFSNDLKFRAAARVLLAKCHQNMGNMEESEKQSREAAADDPENTEARILVLRLQKSE